jgi:putative ABC transport system permease protein
MIGWTLRRAKASLMRDAFLTRIQVGGLALGIAVWITAHVAIDTQTRSPHVLAPSLFRVEAKRRGPETPDRDHSYMRVNMRVHSAVGWDEGRSLVSIAGGATHARTFASELALSPDSGPVRVRFCDRDLFALFGDEWVAGAPWTRDDELAQQAVSVIDQETAIRWFGTTDAVGRTFRLGAREVRVTGVIALRFDSLRLYDISSFTLPEEVFLPVALWPLLDATPVMTHPVRDATGSGSSLEVGAFLHFWISLPDLTAREAFRSRLHEVGREHDVALTLQPVAEWTEQITRVPPGFSEFELIATLALIASALNLVRLYMAKFHARAREVCIHRAMGATRAQVFLVHLAETELVALAGTILGLLLGKLGLVLLNLALPDRFVVYSLDWSSVAAAAAVGLLAGGLAGLYPAWRVGSLPPATFLRRE